MIVSTHAVLGVSYACVLYFCICSCSGQLSMFHMERRSRNTITTLPSPPSPLLLSLNANPFFRRFVHPHTLPPPPPPSTSPPSLCFRTLLHLFRIPINFTTKEILHEPTFFSLTLACKNSSSSTDVNTPGCERSVS